MYHFSLATVLYFVSIFTVKLLKGNLGKRLSDFIFFFIDKI